MKCLTTNKNEVTVGKGRAVLGTIRGQKGTPRRTIMKIKTLLFVLAVFLLRARGLDAQTAPDSALLIVAKEDNTLLIVNPASLKVTAKLPVGPIRTK